MSSNDTVDNFEEMRSHKEELSREEKLKAAKERLRQFQSQRRQLEDGQHEEQQQEDGVIAENQQSVHDAVAVGAIDHVHHLPSTKTQSESPAINWSTYQTSDTTIPSDHFNSNSDMKVADNTETTEKERERHLEQSIEVLVTEKNELGAKLKATNSIVGQLKDELTTSKSKIESMELEKSRQQSELISVEERFKVQLEALRRDNSAALDEYRLESDELRRKLEIRDRELLESKETLTTTQRRLEMAEVNLTQLRSALAAKETERSGSDPNEPQRADMSTELEELRADNARLKERESELSNYIHQATLDREQIIHQYTAYSQQLAEQMEHVSHQLVAKAAECDRLEAREAELVAHVAAMETQLQRNNDKIVVNRDQLEDMESKNNEETILMRERMASMDSKLNDVITQRDCLQTQVLKLQEEVRTRMENMEEYDAHIKELETRNEMLESQSSSLSAQASMIASNESDRIAASRAVSQNVELKEHQRQLETALIDLNNAKADLMNQVDSLQRSNARLQEQQCQQSIELQGLHAGIKERERKVVALKEELKIVKRELESQTQAEERLVAKFNSQSSRVEMDEETRIEGNEDDIKKAKTLATSEKISDPSILDELLEAKATIRSLESERCDLKAQLELLRSRETTHSSNASNPSRTESRSGSSGTESPTVTVAAPSIEDTSHESGEPEGNIKSLSHPSAFALLEDRFNAAMQTIAELSNEKDRLEHQNVQLQEETELVGEYITLYQYQRQKIKDKMADKDKELKLMSIEREQLKSKLEQLQKLVASFVKVKEDHVDYVDEIATEAVVHEDKRNMDNSLNGNVEKSNDHVDEDASTLEQGSHKTSEILVDDDQKKKADQIMSLLSEIGANQMLQERFHPWFWEPDVGRLMTV